ncbi:MAG: helix-turn-helix domain-containing protein [Frankiaceae bacterium]
MTRDATRRQLGEFLRAQRELANLSIRQLARLADVSDSYLSQVERGLYRPSADVLKAVALVLHLQPESLYARLGLMEERTGGARDVEEAIRHDPRLTAQKKDALLRLYRTLVADADAPQRAQAADPAARRRGHAAGGGQPADGSAASPSR